MTFKTVFQNKTTQVITEPKIKIIHGSHNEDNPELDVYVSLILQPNQKYESETENSKDLFARFGEIIYREDGTGGEIFLKAKTRPNWDKHEPVKGDYVVEFLNETPTEYTFYSKFAGNFTCYSYLPKKINLSPLNPFAQFKEVVIRYVQKVNMKTGRLRPREATAVGVSLRKKEDLEQLEKDKIEILKKHNLVEENYNSETGLM